MKSFAKRMVQLTTMTPVLDITTKAEQTKLIVVLDIDETLIHSHPKLPTNSRSFTIKINEWETCVSPRPHVDWFLREASSKFELMTFTAGTESYASQILDKLDPNKVYIKSRYYRHHCVRINDETFLKDLSRINSSLNRIVLVDNNIISFATHPDNGIPIKSFFGRDSEDVELKTLMHILDELSNEPDVRPLLKMKYDIRKKLFGEEKVVGGESKL